MSSTSATLRVATAADAAPIAAIYAPYIVDSAISFELEPPSAEEMAARIARIAGRYPWLVAEQADRVVGYAYASENRARPAYRWGVEVTVYLERDAHGRGIGRQLYAALFALLRSQGFVNAYGIITLPNPASVGIHEALGFRQAGVFRHAGFKNGQWLDVGWYQLALCEPPALPTEPIPFAELDRAVILDMLGSVQRSQPRR